MPTTYPIPTLLNIGSVCQYLSLVSNTKAKGFKGGTTDTGRPAMIYLVRKSLKWKYETDPNDIYIDAVGNYLYALCSNYIQAALIKLGEGQGGIIVDPGSGQPLFLRAYRDQFTVTPTSTPAADTTVYNLPITNIMVGSLEIILVGGGELPVNDDTQFSYNVVYGTSNTVVTFNQPLAVGQQFIVRAYRAIAGGSDSGGGGGGGDNLPLQAGHDGEVLLTDGSNVFWGSLLDEITNIDFENDGLTYLNNNLSKFTFGIFWNEASRFLLSSEFTRISGGGFVLSASLGFDASVQTGHFNIILKGLYA